MKIAIPALILIFLLYLLIFPTQLRPELAIKPAWAVNVASAPVEKIVPSRTASVFPFDLGGLFGYVSAEGKLLLREEKLFGVAIDEQKYSNYSSVSGNLVIHDRSGSVTETVELPGYPVFHEGREFLISSHRAAIAELVDGEISWKREYTSVITDFDVQDGLVAIGLLDSRVQIVDENGGVTLELDMKGSRINAVYGCALSDDASRVAVIHGIDPQNLSIVEVSGEAPEISGYRLETEYRKARYLGFYGSDRYLIIERNDGLKILDLADDAEYTIKASAPFVKAGKLGSDNLIWAICGDDQAYELLVLDPPAKVPFRIPLAGLQDAYSKEDRILLGIENKLCLLKKEVR